jgi:excisionase family DNA binding protein
MTEKKFYRPDELALALEVHVETVRRWIREHRIWHIHDAKGVRISHDECEYIITHGVRKRKSAKHGLGLGPM